MFTDTLISDCYGIGLGENDEGFGVSPLYLDENACVFSDVGV
jgi:hypothetical protein